MCASPGYLERYGTPQTPRELASHSCLAYTNAPDPNVWEYVDADGRKNSVRVRSCLYANNGDFMCQIAAAGHAITRQPNFILYRAIEQGSLVPILTDYTWAGVNAYAVYPQTRHLSHRVRAFVDFLAQRFAGTPYWDECVKP